MCTRCLIALLLLVFAQSNPRYFRYQRPITGTSAQGQTCATIDAATFAHAAPGLTDLRVYRNDSQETPYVLRIATPVTTQQANIQPLNLGSRNGNVVFDAEMPHGSYSSIQINLEGRNFIATVAVSGSQTQDPASATRLGTYNVFDLSDQRLGRSTVLHLPVSDFRYLHFQMSGPIKSEEISGISVDSEPVQPAEYLTVAEASQVSQQGQSSVFEFSVPANVPIDRIEFLPASDTANFSRDVTVEVAGGKESQEPASYHGEIRSVHGMHSGRRIDDEQLTIKLGNALIETPSRWSVKIDNGDDLPVTLKAVSLQMQKRILCFDAMPSASYTLSYGDSALTAPRYDYANFFQPEKDASQAKLGAEQNNPQYEPRPDERPFTEKHPALLWIALVLAVAVLGSIALRSAKQVTPKP
jgi:hypothetical protein